ncbi:hypothetical protein ACFXOS_18915 [Streptomyces sp. NPDC059175]|uniref:hypothetical protein n=1 Tax=Streptomyces sp. NPDC059175 TaxID=3346757 RepID=UPI0036A2A707
MTVLPTEAHTGTVGLSLAASRKGDRPAAAREIGVAGSVCGPYVATSAANCCSRSSSPVVLPAG